MIPMELELIALRRNHTGYPRWSVSYSQSHGIESRVPAIDFLELLKGSEIGREHVS